MRTAGVGLEARGNLGLIFPGLLGQLDDNVVFLNEIQFPADEILNHLRVVLQTVDGAGQPTVFRGQTGGFLVQRLALLAQAINPVEAPVAEESQQGYQADGERHAHQEMVPVFALLGPFRSSSSGHEAPPPRSSLSCYFA